MKLEGDFTFNAPRDKVWAILNDPEVLGRHMPGCQSLDPVGEDEFEAVLSIGVAAIKGTYKARLRVTDKEPPAAYRLHVEGSGKPGHVKGEGQVHLSEQDGQTHLRYEGDLHVGGLIARVGQRMLGSITQRMTRDFFQALGSEAESG